MVDDVTGLVDELAGRYRLEDLISRGGMGEVWRAQDTRLGREVAIKVLTDGLAEATDRDRFLREARLAAQLSHPNVVSIYDVGEREGRPYIVMELLEGRTLADEVAERGPLPIAEVRTIGAQIAAGLGAAHAIGVIHRDVKPRNLFLTNDGTVKVLDFGIARLANAAATRLTRTGLVIGTAAYVAPEQLTGGTADERSDLYALGCVLYELVTGRAPFEGSIAVLAYSHVHEEHRPLFDFRVDVPPDVDGLINALLAKDPSRRPQRASHVAGQLASVAPAPGETDTVIVRVPAQAAASSDTGSLPASEPSTSSSSGFSDGPGDTGRLPVQDLPPRFRRRRPFLPALMVGVAVILLGVLFFLAWKGPLSGGPNATSTQKATPETLASNGAARPSTQRSNRPPTQQKAPAYASKEWLDDLEDQVVLLLSQDRIDDSLAGDIRDKIDNARQEIQDGKPNKAQKELRELRRDLADAIEDGESIPDEGLLGTLLS